MGYETRLVFVGSRGLTSYTRSSRWLAGQHKSKTNLSLATREAMPLTSSIVAKTGHKTLRIAGAIKNRPRIACQHYAEEVPGV
jgi:hypothetical protein